MGSLLPLLALAAGAGASAGASLTPAYGREPEVVLSPREAECLAAARARLPGAIHAPSLSLAARDLAARTAAGERDPLAPPAVAAALARAAAFDPAPVVAHVRAVPASAAAEAIASRLRAIPATHLGAGVVERDGAAHAVVLVSERRARIEPFPRAVAAGKAAELRGRLQGLAAPRVFATDPAGRSREMPVRGDSPFSATLRFEKAGRWRIEVLGTGPEGPEVAALLAVAAGNTRLEPPRAPPGPDPDDAAAAEARVAAEVNALRARAGLAPVEPDTRLRELARRQAADMLAAGKLAHVLPGSGPVGERLRRARIPYRAALENLARGSSALEAQRTLEESPAHLHNLLAPEVERIGVGIARGRNATGEPTVYLAQIMTRPVDDSSDSRVRPEERVREVLWRARARAGHAPLTADPRLDEIAGRAARDMLRAGDVAEGDAARRALALGRGIAAADVLVAASPEDAGRQKSVEDGRLRRVGVGVAVGDSPRYGSGMLWIVVVYTD